MPSAIMLSPQVEVYSNVLIFYNILIYSWSRFFSYTSIFLKLHLVNNSTNHSNCTWRSDMRSWQDWFPGGEVTSSLVPQACLHPNSAKDFKKGKIKFVKELNKQIFKKNENYFFYDKFFKSYWCIYKRTPVLQALDRKQTLLSYRDLTSGKQCRKVVKCILLFSRIKRREAFSKCFFQC